MAQPDTALRQPAPDPSPPQAGEERGPPRIPPIILAVAASLFVHLAIALWLASVLILPAAKGVNMDGGGVDVAIMSDAQLTDLRTESASALASMEASGDLPDTSSMVESLIAGADLPALDREAAALISSSGGATALGLEVGAGSGLSGLGGGSARFFGVEARGNRFAYVVDASGSMRGERIERLKNELVDSINQLRPAASYIVILFNSRAVPLSGDDWAAADEAKKRETFTLLGGVTGEGGTNPLTAMEIALNLKPRPDGIYFMTDGEFAREVEQQLVTLVDRSIRAGGRRTELHCITFVSRDSEKLMRRLARVTGGTYNHIEGAPR